MSVAAGILIAAAMIVSAIVVTNRRAQAPAPPAVSVSSSPPAATPPPRNVPPVPDAALPGLLLAEQQVADITAAGPLKLKPGAADDWDDEADNDLFEKDCAGAFDIAQRTVYAHTGVRAVQHQEFLATDKQAGAGQAVVAFDTAAAARQVVSDQSRQWAACASRTVAYKEPGQPQANWKFGPLQHVNGDLAITTEWVDGKNAILCQHALGARNNIVIDAAVCRPAVDNRGLDLLNAIAAKVPSSAASPPSPANVAPLPPSALKGLLLPVKQVADIAGAGAMTNDGPSSSGWGDEAGHMGEGETDCAGSFSSAERTVYAASTAQAVWDQVVTAVDKQASAVQAVVAFPTADAARRFVADQARPWNTCAGRSVAYKAPGAQQQNWRYEPLQRQANGDLAITTELIGAPNGMQCQHALGARNNIVIDTGVCRPAVDNRGLELLHAISAKVPS
jgi:hypothetical protein